MHPTYTAAGAYRGASQGKKLSMFTLCQISNKQEATKLTWAYTHWDGMASAQGLIALLKGNLTSACTVPWGCQDMSATTCISDL